MRKNILTFSSTSNTVIKREKKVIECVHRMNSCIFSYLILNDVIFTLHDTQKFCTSKHEKNHRPSSFAKPEALNSLLTLFMDKIAFVRDLNAS